MKPANSILESFEYFCQMSAKSIILSYTVSRLVRFWDTVYIRRECALCPCVCVLDVTWLTRGQHHKTAAPFGQIRSGRKGCARAWLCKGCVAREALETEELKHGIRGKGNVTKDSVLRDLQPCLLKLEVSTSVNDGLWPLCFASRPKESWI